VLEAALPRPLELGSCFGRFALELSANCWATRCVLGENLCRDNAKVSVLCAFQHRSQGFELA